MGATLLTTAIAFVAGTVGLAMVSRWLGEYGSAEPNERSNHKRPTPQTGGIALVPSWIAAVQLASLAGYAVPVFSTPQFTAAVLVLFVAGIIDDRHSLGAVAKLLPQFLAALLAVMALHDTLQGTGTPPWIAAAGAFLMLVVMTNLVNFIDGLDLMAVATVSVPSLFFMLFALTGVIATGYAPAGAALAACFAVFAFANFPPARLFLGDGGSLPFGLVIGAMVVIVTVEAGFVAGLLLAGYLLIDGIYTLIRRMTRLENIFRAHSSHVYQRAFRGGRTVLQVIGATALFGFVSGAAALAAGVGGAATKAGAVVVSALAWALIAGWMLDLRAGKWIGRRQR